MNTDGILLNMDMSDVCIIHGDAKQICLGNPDEYVSRIDLYLPFDVDPEEYNSYVITYKTNEIQVVIREIATKEEDVFLKYAPSFNIGTSNQSGLPDVLPFEYFLDNKGKYPVALVSVIFPYRIASWITEANETGIKMDYDYERVQILGVPQNNEKIEALLVLNQFFKELKPGKYRTLEYENICTFIEVYFIKGKQIPSLTKVNALVAKNAYREAIERYYLQHLDIKEVKNRINVFVDKTKYQNIDDEEKLYLLIAEVVDDVFIQYIENRHWIEPFWDGKRKVNIDGNDHEIPSFPKNETRIQPTLHVLLDMALSSFGIHVIRESNEGCGLLDFRFLFTTRGGKRLTVGMEFKIAHHKKIQHGLAVQLPQYLRSINTIHGLFLVMWFKDEKYFNNPKEYELITLKKYLETKSTELGKKTGFVIMPIVIDASIRKTASV